VIQRLCFVVSMKEPDARRRGHLMPPATIALMGTCIHVRLNERDSASASLSTGNWLFSSRSQVLQP
jgi:hypothetical protein